MLDKLAIPHAETADNASGPSLTLTAWQQLRDDIICGKLRPKQRLRIDELRELYGIGASPIREALSRLVPEGFVISLERRGFQVAPLSLEEFRELTDIRKLLEKEAARLSLAHGNDSWESQVIAALHRLSKWQAKSAGKLTPAMREWETLHENFLEQVMAGSSSQWLLHFRRNAYAYAKRYMRVCLSATVIRDLHKEHKAMANAAIDRDIQTLQSLLDAQIERIYRAVESSGKI